MPEEDEYLEIARLFLPELLARIRDGQLTAPIEVLLSDVAGIIGTWQVDGFGKFVDVADTDHALRRVEFPVSISATDRNGNTWKRHVEKEELPTCIHSNFHVTLRNDGFVYGRCFNCNRDFKRRLNKAGEEIGDFLPI